MPTIADVRSSHKLSSGASEFAKVALAGTAARALLAKHRQRTSSKALHEGKSVQEVLDQQMPPAEEKPKSRLQELWDKESNLQLRGLPSHRKRSSSVASLLPIDSKLDSYEVGMVRLVNSVARDLHNQHSSLQARKSFKQLGQDMHHSIRVCNKAKEFVDLGLDGALQRKKKSELLKEDIRSDSSHRTRRTTERVDATSRPPSAALEDAWDGLFKDIDPMSPKSAKSSKRLHRSWTTSSLGTSSSQVQVWR